MCNTLIHSDSISDQTKLESSLLAANCSAILNNLNAAVAFFYQALNLYSELGKPQELYIKLDQSQELYINAIKLGLRAINLYSRNSEAHSKMIKSFEELGKPKNALEFYTNAIELGLNDIELRRNDYCKVIDYCEQAINTDDKNAQAYYLMGRCLESIGQPQDAVKFYDRARELGYENFNLYYQRGLCLEHLGQYQSAAKSYIDGISLHGKQPIHSECWKSDHKKIIDLFNKAIELNPNDSTVHFEKATFLADIQNYQDAITLCRDAIKLGGNDFNVYVLMARCFEHLEQYQSAAKSYIDGISLQGKQPIHSECWKSDHKKIIDFFNQAIKLNPNDSTVHFQKARFLVDTQNYKDALASCHAAIELGLKNMSLYYLAGISLENLKKYTSALEFYNIIITFEPDNADAYYHIGICHENLGQYTKALEFYNKIIGIKPGNADAYYHIGICHENLGHYQDAIVSYNKTIQLTTFGSDNFDVFYHIATCFEKTGQYKYGTDYYILAMEYGCNDYKHIFKFCTNTLEHDPQNPKLHYMIGLCYEDEANYPDALKCYDKAREFGLDNFDLSYHKGICLQALGKFQEALDGYWNKLSIDCSNYSVVNQAKLYLNKGICLYELGQYPEAIKFFNKTMELGIELYNSEADMYKLDCRNKFYDIFEEDFGKQSSIELMDSVKQMKDVNPGLLGNYLVFEHDSTGLQHQIEMLLKILKNRYQSAIASYNNEITLDHEAGCDYYKKVISCCNHAISIDPDNPDAYYLIGRCRDNLKQPQEALAAYHKAIGLYDKATKLGLGNVDLENRKVICLEKLQMGCFKTSETYNVNQLQEDFLDISKNLSDTQDQMKCSGLLHPAVD